MRYVVIMAGGSGTRLWPLSKQGMPKQLLPLFDGKSLLRLAYERVAGFIPDAQILTCTSASYAAEVASQLPELPIENILGEPMGRDSLNAVAWSSAVVADRDPDAVVAMVTADQIIAPIEDFRAGLGAAFDVAADQPASLVTLGIVPESPHTGYGYLQRGAVLAGYSDVYQVTQFKEKPDRETAQRYLDSGNYWWNSGMFVWRASTFLTQLTRLMPHTAETVATIVADSSRLDELFGTLEKTSVDYAIMEPAAQPDSGVSVYAVGLEVAWRDLGGYLSLAAELATDSAGNTRDGLTLAYDSTGCLIINTAGDHLVATLGLQDCLVIHTDRATLVAPMAETERIKQLVGSVRDNFGVEFS